MGLSIPRFSKCNYYEIIIKNSDSNRRITIINKRLRTNQECENRNRKDLRQLWYMQNHHRKGG